MRLHGDSRMLISLVFSNTGTIGIASRVRAGLVAVASSTLSRSLKWEK